LAENCVFFLHSLVHHDTTRYISVGICSEVHSEETKSHGATLHAVKTESL